MRELSDKNLKQLSKCNQILKEKNNEKLCKI